MSVSARGALKARNTQGRAKRVTRVIIPSPESLVADGLGYQTFEHVCVLTLGT
jgi:hypothetical protein